MIYVSSACSKKTDIRESVLELAHAGFKNIELSGGTDYSDTLETDLLELKNSLGLNFLLHNYFPPPQSHFVLNLAAADKETRLKSLEHIRNALKLSEKLGANAYAIHAGYFIEPRVEELGKAIEKKQVTNALEGTERFIQGLKEVQAFGAKVCLYIENNVLSDSNFKTFKANPFMLTDAAAYDDLYKQFPFHLLLDIAHLKVSCRSLGREFQEEFRYLNAKTDYLHLSDNDGLHDTNQAIYEDSELIPLLRQSGFHQKTVTLEIYSGLDEVKKTMNLLNDL